MCLEATKTVAKTVISTGVGTGIGATTQYATENLWNVTGPANIGKAAVFGLPSVIPTALVYGAIDLLKDGRNCCSLNSIGSRVIGAVFGEVAFTCGNYFAGELLDNTIGPVGKVAVLGLFGAGCTMFGTYGTQRVIERGNNNVGENQGLVVNHGQ